LGQLQSQLNRLGFKIKQRMIQEATFIYSDPEHAKGIEFGEMKQKKEGERWNMDKKWVVSHTLDINFTI